VLAGGGKMKCDERLPLFIFPVLGDFHPEKIMLHAEQKVIDKLLSLSLVRQEDLKWKSWLR